jgi:hypothetical protein
MVAWYVGRRTRKGSGISSIALEHPHWLNGWPRSRQCQTPRFLEAGVWHCLARDSRLFFGSRFSADEEMPDPSLLSVPRQGDTRNTCTDSGVAGTLATPSRPAATGAPAAVGYSRCRRAFAGNPASLAAPAASP